ncbi:metallophosphoesterase [Pedobacter sp. HMF7647]|uniref:Metallophosphoesterase n=1 Tax=Hufsiella arboris TaxID=2695275 RepID=A0A7K1YCL8_9SPHI|nr:metallophosphoesterase [Hufsiella arboris]MXV52324.1 metallophosphoesterase [Hufsiella arboris]
MICGVRFLLLSLFLLSGCDAFEYSPNVAFDNNSPRDINAKNLQKLLTVNNDDTIKIALTGDTQRSYEQTAAFVDKLNSIPNIDFVFLAGDISDFGLLQEMKWVNDYYSKLKVPYFGVIGNHDRVANGKEVFINMYGPVNYSFVFDGVKFVCYDSNGRESNFDGTTPDIEWIQNELKPQAGVNNFVTVCHVPAGDGDFDPTLFVRYGKVLDTTPGLLASLNAHKHKSGVYYPYGDNIPYIITSAIQHREFTIIKIFNGQLNYEFIDY